MDTPTYGQILTQQKSKETPPCGQDPKGFFGIKERTLSIGNQLDREGRLRSELRPAGRLDSSSARPGGSTQERAATSGSARLIFSSTGRVDSGASCDQRVGSTHLQLDREGRLRSELRPAGRLDSSARLGLSRVRSAHRSRLSGLDSSGSPSPLQAGKTRLTAQLGLRGSTSAASEVSAADGRGLATRLRAHPWSTTQHCTLRASCGRHLPTGFRTTTAYQQASTSSPR
ncbi:unnamed protein product [Lampetra planeri]